MFITDIISITELSRLTKKSRPTLYKYISDYKNGKFDEVPYTFIKLLDLSSKDGISRESLRQYCQSTYGDFEENDELRKIIILLQENQNSLDLKKIRIMIEGEIKNDWYCFIPANPSSQTNSAL